MDNKIKKLKNIEKDSKCKVGLTVNEGKGFTITTENCQPSELVGPGLLILAVLICSKLYFR